MHNRSTRTGTADTTLDSSTPAPLALRPREAAAALGIGQRLLWDLTAPRGSIPSVKIGCCVLYPVPMLQAWLAAEAGKTVRP